MRVIRTEIKNSCALLSDKKDMKATGLPTPIYPPKLSDQKFEIAILFSIVERSNNCVFRCKMISQNAWGEACKLWNSPIVHKNSGVIEKPIQG